MEIGSHCTDDPLNPAIGAKVPLAGSEQQLPSEIFETKNGYRNHARYNKNAEEHFAQYFQMAAEGQLLAIILRSVCLCRCRFRLFRFLLVLFRLH